MKWKKVKLTDISKPKQWKNLPISELTSEGYAVYGANGVIGRYKEYNHEFPTLAITCRGATCGTINITEPKSYITSNAMALDNISEDVDQKFLYYALNKRGFKDVITGAAQPQITREGLSKIVLDIPERKEYQLHIANLLSKSENLIAYRKESLHQLDEFLKSTFLEMFGDPVRNEKGWIKDKVIAFTDCIVPGRDKPKSFTGNVPWFTTEDLIHKGYVTKSKKGLGLSKEEIKEVRARVIPAGSVLLTCVGDLGIISVCKEDCVVNQQLHAFICKDEINSLFLMYALSFQTNFMYKKATSTTVPYMNKTTCNSIPVIVPPIELQTQFAHIVEKTEALKTQYQQSLQELENLYGSLIQKAFRGELSIIKNQKAVQI